MDECEGIIAAESVQTVQSECLDECDGMISAE